MTVLPAWFYDELRQTGVDFEDTEQVEAYDRNQRANPEADQALLQRLGVQEGHTLIDIGTGTGTLAIQAYQAGACIKVHCGFEWTTYSTGCL